MEALHHLLGFIIGTKKRGLKFDPKALLELIAYVDAAFSTHYDGHS